MRLRVPRAVSWKYLTDLGYSIALLGLSQALNYFFSINIANRLSPVDFGIFSTIVAMIYLLGVLSTTIQNAFTKAVAPVHEQNLRSFYKEQLIRFAWISLLGAGLTFIASPLLAQATHIPLVSVRIFSLYVVAMLFTFVPRGFLLGQQKVKLVNTLVFVEVVVKFAWSYWVATSSDAIWAYTAPSLLIGLVMLFFVRFKGEKPLAPTLAWSEYIKIFIVIFLVQLPFSIDVLLSPESLRPSYSALVLLGKIIFFASAIVTGVMFANAAKDARLAARRTKLYIALGCTALLGLVISLLYFVFPIQIILVVFKGHYAEIIPYLGWYGVGFTVFALGYTCVNYLIINNRYRIGWGLLLIVAVQIVLLLNYSPTLSALVLNQIIIYSVIGLYGLWETFFKNEEKRN